MASREMLQPVNLHQADGDPRKMIAVRHLVGQYPEAITYWHGSGITERVAVAGNEGARKHKHGVLAHMFGGAVFAQEIALWLKERGALDDSQLREVVLANLVHDADKVTDMKLIIMAMGGKDGTGEVSWAKVEEIVRGAGLTEAEQVLEELRREYERYFDPAVDVGERVHVARALVAGRVHKERLAQTGCPERVIDIQGSTEYTGCDEVDGLVDKYPRLSQGGKYWVIQKAVVNYVDNGMRESELVDPRTRTVAVFQKPINIALSKSYVRWNGKGETAESKQIRVGEKVGAFLAALVGVEPENFLGELEARVQKRISSL